jgi:phage tail-like protein
MDANRTRFHLLLGSDWSSLQRDPHTTDIGDAEIDTTTWEYRLHQKLFEFVPPRGDRIPSIADRRGAAVDRFGNWYWIDVAPTSIRVNSAGSGATTLYWEAGYGDAPVPVVQRPGAFAPVDVAPQPVLELGGAAVTVDHYLVVGIVDPKGLLVFDLRLTGGPRRMSWPDTVLFEPFDMAPRLGGGVWILDRENRRLWELDREFLVISRRSSLPAPTGSFAPVEGGEPSAPRRFGVVDVHDALKLSGDPVSVESAPDGSLLVLDRGDGSAPSHVRRYVDGVERGSFALADPSGAPAFVGHDIALVPAPAPRNGKLGSLFAVDANGDQAYRFALSVDAHGKLNAALEPEYYPMRMFEGKALVADGKSAYYDFADRFIPLVLQPRPRFDASATVISQPFDSGTPGTVWHRILLDGSIPPGTSVTVSTRAADEKNEVAALAWNVEPAPYLRGNGSELPYVATPARRGTYELLLQRSKGRFVQLRLELAGDGRTTPRLSALRLYYPRFSYLDNYLPHVYREDPISASFLERFLANPEGIATAIEDRIAAAQVLFDARSAPPETLDWLASWFDFALDPNWPVARRRLFIEHAMDFFAVRGTVRGLEMALRLALDPPSCVDKSVFDTASQPTSGPRIIEQFRTRRTPAVVLGDPTESEGLRVVTPGERWLPAEGRDSLFARWRTYLGTDDAGVELPLQPDNATAAAWTSFVQSTLGFVPSSSPDEDAWHDFLTRRYAAIASLNTAYGLSGSGRYDAFADIPYPTEIPPDGAPLVDWFQFEAVVLPMRANASRFTALLPVPTTDEPSALTNDQRRDLATRVLNLHKPAHTTFDVRFFWSAFRVGESRLGDDTVIDLGSRSPRLLEPAVLGSRYVGESTLGGDPPPILTNPPSIGRNPVLR